MKKRWHVVGVYNYNYSLPRYKVFQSFWRRSSAERVRERLAGTAMVTSVVRVHLMSSEDVESLRT